MVEKKKVENDFFKTRIKYYTLLFLEIIFWLADIFLVKTLEIEHLLAIEVVHISFDWAGMFLMIIILYSCIKGREIASSNAFINFIFSVDLCLFFEVGIWAVDRIEKLRTWNYVYNIGSNSMLLISTLCYLEFVCISLDIDKKKIPRLYASARGMILIGILMEILNVRFHYYYYIDASGTYIRGELGSIIGYIPFVYILGLSGYLVLTQEIEWSRKINYLSYFGVPFLISIWYTLTGCPPTLFAASAISVFILYVNIYIYQGREMEAIVLEGLCKDVELAWERNQQMRAQIKPHFIFNCLGSIEMLCKLDAEKARKAIHHFSKYLRVNMDSISEKNLIPFSSELEHIRNYVWLEKMRFEDDLEYQEEISTTGFYLPPLTIQPLVENAVKHGMMGMEEGVLKVTLSVKETENAYEIQITDNGAGFDPNEPPNDGRSHIGIQNVRKSLKYKVKGTLLIESEIGKGTRIQVCIPKEMAENENPGSR